MGDLEKADELLRPLAEGGNANAMREMALLEWRKTQGMREPEPVVACLEKACQWADKAKEAGDKRAEALLKTLETRRDTVRGATPEGLLYSGMRLLDGDGVEQDEKAALRMLEISANSGNGAAAGVLGLCYAKGEHVQQDDEQARKWFEQGAAHENPESMMNLAYMYVNGIGGQTDLKRAAELYEQACKGWFCACRLPFGTDVSHGAGCTKGFDKGI